MGASREFVMMSRQVAVVLLAAGCVSAAGGGAYLAIRQNTAAAVAAQPDAITAPAAPIAPSTVSETEAVIEPSKEQPKAAPTASPVPRRETRPAVAPRRSAVPVAARETAPAVRESPAPAMTERAAEAPAVAPEPPVPAPLAPIAPPAADPEPSVATPPAPVLEEITIPASAVIGLEVETPLTSEKARVEDRIDARVTRDVYAEGKLAIPAGARMIGSVTVVERGGKVKERARLGVRFHTLVLADGRRVDVRTDTIFREGQSPTGESSRKIGGAAVGGAVLGAIMGGGKGAMIGGAAGAAGGTAAVMAGGRNAATIAVGTVLNSRVAAPVTIEVERR